MLTRLKTSLAAIGPDPLRLSASTAFGAFPIGFLNIVLPIYFNKVGLDSSIIGQLYAVSAVTSAVLLVLFGLLADRFGRKPFVIGGTLLPAVSYAIFLGTTDPVWLTLAAGIGGVGLANGLSGALAGSSFNALLAEKTSDENRTMVFSLGSAAWTGALMAGALLGGLPEWLQSLGFGLVDSYRPLFWLSLLMAALAALVIVPIRERHTERSVHERPSLIPRRSLGAISRLTLVWGIIGLGLGFSVQLLSLWFYLKFKVSGDFLGPWYASSEALSMAAMYLVPKIARRIGAANMVLGTQITSGLFLGAMAFAPTAAVAAGLYLVRNFMMNLAWPVHQSYIMGVVDPSERATASSLTSAAWGLASAVSPAISGVWLDQGLLMLPMLAGGGSYLLSVLIFYGFFRSVPLPKEAGGGQQPPPKRELSQAEI